MLLLDLGWFESGLRAIMAWLCSFIYKLIASLFELFINISKVELLKSKEITPIYQRVTMILTIVMVFYVTFELVKYIIQPDTMKDKEKGASKVVVRMILVVVLIAFVPTAFSLAYRLQNAIIEREVLSKVILGRSNTSSESFGRNFSADMFSLFYYFDTNIWDENEECKHVGCQTLVDGNISSLRTRGQLENLNYALNESDEIKENGIKQEVAKIHFDGLFAVLVGGFLVYILVLYCIDLGVRVAQITFLQIIAPIPIIGYLQPKKDNMFNKWVKQCLTTYLDLFMRLAIIYFILLVCKIIADAYNNGTLIQGIDDDASTFVYIAVIMGLLLFAQKAPKMLQELFPKMGAASGNFGLKGAERVAPLAARAIGAGTGLARAGIRAGIARGKNIHDRNKRLKEKLRAEGKPTDRKSMRQARREAKQNAKESDKQLKNQSRQLSKAEKELRAAEKEEADAKKGTDQNKINAAKAKVAKAKEKYDTLRNGSERYKNYQEAEADRKNADKNKQKAEQNKADAEQKLTDAQNRRAVLAHQYQNETDPAKKAQLKQDLQDAIKEEQKAGKEVRDAKDKLNIAESEFNNADSKFNQTKADFEAHDYNKDSLASRLLKEAEDENSRVQNDPNATQAEKDAAQRRYEQAKTRYDLEQRTGYLGVKSENITAQSNLADQRNQSYGAPVGVQAVASAIRGGVTGAVSGAKAKKLGEVWKQSGEGVKKVIKRENENVQFLQDGGSATFSGVIDRTVAHAEQKVGIKTHSETMKMEVKDYQDKIKLLNSEAEKETQVKTFLDSAKQRSGTKLDAGEQRMFIDSALDDIKMSDGTIISWADASGGSNPYDGKHTTSSMLQEIRDQQNRAVNEAESANQVYNEAEANYAKMENDPSTDPAELARERIRVDNLKKKRDATAAEAEKRKAVTQLARKKLLEYGVAKAIRGDRSDNILYDTISSLRNAIDVSRNIPAARDHMHKCLVNKYGENSPKFAKIWNAFINNDIRDYEDVDVIEGFLTNHVGQLKNESSMYKAQSDKLSESSWKGAADASAGSGSGNK